MVNPNDSYSPTFWWRDLDRLIFRLNDLPFPFVEARENRVYLDYGRCSVALFQNGNNVEAMFQVGLCHVFGSGGIDKRKSRLRRGCRLIDLAAREECSMAVFQVANLLNAFGRDNGEQSRWWYNKAVELLKKEARNGNTESQWLLGRCYYSTTCDLPFQPLVVAELWEEAAKNGHAFAPLYLAVLYTRIRRFRPVDIIRVIQLLQLALSRGNSRNIDAEDLSSSIRRDYVRCDFQFNRMWRIAHYRNQADRLDTIRGSDLTNGSFVRLLGWFSSAWRYSDRSSSSRIYMFVRRCLPDLLVHATDNAGPRNEPTPVVDLRISSLLRTSLPTRPWFTRRLSDSEVREDLMMATYSRCDCTSSSTIVLGQVLWSSGFFHDHQSRKTSPQWMVEYDCGCREVLCDEDVLTGVNLLSRPHRRDRIINDASSSWKISVELLESFWSISVELLESTDQWSSWSVFVELPESD